MTTLEGLMRQLKFELEHENLKLSFVQEEMIENAMIVFASMAIRNRETRQEIYSHYDKGI